MAKVKLKDYSESILIDETTLKNHQSSEKN